MRFQHGAEASFDTATGWLFDGMAAAFRSGAARLAIVGEDPSLLAGQDPDKVARANRARSKAYLPALELIVGLRHQLDHRLLRDARPGRRRCFPDEPEDVAVAQLWDAIFAASRVDTPDPIAAWAGAQRGLAGAASAA